ncbi:PA domain-containing protein [uncultured Tenacibaculum sp.]|uniref:PA domain-containing protein n=1 Tax=uncultured Tenacibaculum sp. TaxID=174713 RepID=UPI0026091128|nr:PA domain-containing protein [uncultured Tenacibaculum sp.]
MKRKLLYLIPIVSIIFIASFFIIKPNESKALSKIEKLRKSHAKFLKEHPYQKTGNLSRQERKDMGLPPNAYFEQKYLSEINPSTGRVHKENVFDLQEQLNNIQQRVPGDAADNPWIERGPNNVGGRTRAVIFDPNDPTSETVIAGGVSGGLWKNTAISDSNSQWERLNIPENISVSSIAIDPNDSKVFYVGTGESYVSGDVNGNGLWKSIDGGNSWSKVFGGITGDAFLDADSQVTVNSPSSIPGNYDSILANFGGNLTSNISGSLVLANDGTGVQEDACEDLINQAEINGNIAIIFRGSCSFTDKALKAQNAGAIGVIIVNNVAGNPIGQSGTDSSITIPSVMVSQTDGSILINALSTGSINVTLNKTNDNATGSFLVPGIAHINDLTIRNNGGVSEVYIAVADAFYANSNPTRPIIGGDSFGVYKSTDGMNFTRLNLPKTARGNNYEPNNIEIAADNSIYVSTINSDSYGDGGGTILKSTDGNTFNVITTIPNGNRTEITLSSSNANSGYILTQTTDNSNPVKIFRTFDGFVNLSERSLPNDADEGIDANDFTRGQSFYDLLIKIDPNNDNIVYAGGIDLFKSGDGAFSWNQISKWSNNPGLRTLRVPLVHADQHGMAFANSSKVVFSNDGGVYYSSNAGRSISPRKNNYNTLQFYHIGVAPTTTFSGDYFLAGAQDNGTQLFSDVANNIESSTEATGGDGAASFFDQDGTDTYVITNTTFNNSIYFFSEPSLATPFTTPIINDENARNGNFINQQDLDSNLDMLYSNYSLGNNYRIRRYSNFKSGNEADVRKVELSNGLMNASPSLIKVSPLTTSSTKLFVGLENGKLLVVDRANISPTWTDITGDQFVGSISDIEFGATENDIFVTFHNYGVKNIWYTNDGGTTWLDKEGNFPDIPVKSILQNPLNREEVIIGTDLGVWKTSNFSASSPTWTRSDNGMSNVPVLDLDLRDDNVVFAATYGRGVFSGAFTAATASVDEVLQGEKIFTVYPTVSNGEFTVFAKRENGKTNINIFNLSGSQVLTKKVDFNEEERQLISTNLSSGVYLIQVINGEKKISTRKIVIK